MPKHEACQGSAPDRYGRCWIFSEAAGLEPPLPLKSAGWRRRTRLLPKIKASAAPRHQHPVIQIQQHAVRVFARLVLVGETGTGPVLQGKGAQPQGAGIPAAGRRSEEHTSELQ